ncbi:MULTISPECIES: trypsin-like serine protease [Rhodomicrobium]|uniref:S1 family peptidase n=1 Tax=Rhodomicrobium TaxID=1068 RepID=UPI000B4B79D0|nr:MULTISPECIES: trypsin-like serine protease [Rhodomicrobium]
MKPSPSNFLALVLAFAAVSLLPAAASAQGASSAQQQEDADLRAELQRIAEEDPAHAAEAQKALDALDKPESTAEGRQARNRRERGARRIVNGLPSRSHPAVGALVTASGPNAPGAWCTGTLVGCDKFLTAAHCIADNPAPGAYLVFFQELGFFKVKTVTWAKDKYKFPYFDLAMLTLDRPVEGIAPMPVNTSVKPLNNSIATIVGFGRTGGTRLDYGIKREGSVKTSACPPDLAKSQVLCWKFDADVVSSGSAQNTCNADSGGGVFMRDNDGPRVVEKVFGVVSGGTDGNCLKKDLSYNVDVFQYRDWIAAAGEGRLSSAMCGRPLWDDPSREPARQTIRLDGKKPEASFTVEAPPGVTALRVAMNAEDDGKGKNLFQFAAFSKGAGQSENACANTGGGQFAFCAIEKPADGPWTIAVSRKKGQGDVQITTVFVGPDQ